MFAKNVSLMFASVKYKACCLVAKARYVWFSLSSYETQDRSTVVVLLSGSSAAAGLLISKTCFYLHFI